MKKLGRLVVLAVGMIGLAASVFAAGTVTITPTRIYVLEQAGANTPYQTKANRVLLSIAWTGDPTTGSVPVTTINPNTYGISGYYLYHARTIPSAASPPATYSIALNVTYGSVTYNETWGLLASRSTSAIEDVTIATTGHSYPNIIRNWAFTLSGNAAPGGAGIVELIFTSE